MNNSKDLLADADLAINALGGETLSGSGFENEIPEPEFVFDNHEPEGAAR